MHIEAVAHEQWCPADRLPKILGCLVPNGRRQLKLHEMPAGKPTPRGGDEGLADAAAAITLGDGKFGDEAHVADRIEGGLRAIQPRQKPTKVPS
jgi:hypothetical protein